MDKSARRYQSKSVRVLGVGIPVGFLLFLTIPVVQAPLPIALTLSLIGTFAATCAFLLLRRQAIEVTAKGVWIRKLVRSEFVEINHFSEIRLVPGAPAVILTTDSGKVRVIHTSAITSIRGSRRSRQVNQDVVDEINRTISDFKTHMTTGDSATA